MTRAESLSLPPHPPRKDRARHRFGLSATTIHLDTSSDMATVVNMAGLGFPCHSPLRGIRPRAVVVRAEAEGVGVAINPVIRKSEEKVVDSVLISDLTKPLTAYCRCWRSATFPLCDGSHVKHNKATGDNVGPLLLKKPKE